MYKCILVVSVFLMAATSAQAGEYMCKKYELSDQVVNGETKELARFLGKVSEVNGTVPLFVGPFSFMVNEISGEKGKMTATSLYNGVATQYSSYSSYFEVRLESQDKKYKVICGYNLDKDQPAK